MSNTTVKTFKDLVVWRRAFELTAKIHRLTNSFPKYEMYGMSVRLRKTLRTILYNIAEGHKRGRTRAYVQVLRIAAGSAAELGSELLLAGQLGYSTKETGDQVLGIPAIVERMVGAPIHTPQYRLNSNP